MNRTKKALWESKDREYMKKFINDSIEKNIVPERMMLLGREITKLAIEVEDCKKGNQP